LADEDGFLVAPDLSPIASKTACLVSVHAFKADQQRADAGAAIGKASW
jgi:hypothetical protein